MAAVVSKLGDFALLKTIDESIWWPFIPCVCQPEISIHSFNKYAVAAPLDSCAVFVQIDTKQVGGGHLQLWLGQVQCVLPFFLGPGQLTHSSLPGSFPVRCCGGGQQLTFDEFNPNGRDSRQEVSKKGPFAPLCCFFKSISGARRWGYKAWRWGQKIPVAV